MTHRQKRIQEIAYQLWVQEGHPEGRSDSHWLEAVALYEAEIAEPKRGKAGQPAEPVAETKAKPRKPQPAEPAAEKPAPSSKPKAAAETHEPKRKSVEAEPAPKPPAKTPAGGTKRKPAKS